MLQKSNLTIETAVANQSGAMEADTISKNGRSSKSQMSRNNLLKVSTILCFLICTITCLWGQSTNDKIYYFQTIPTETSNEIKECTQDMIDNYNTPCKWYSFSNAKEGNLVFYRRENANERYKIVEGKIINGKKEGEWKFTTTICAPCTDFTHVYNYVSDKRNGKYVSYREKFLIEEGMYVNGKLEGKTTRYTLPELSRFSDYSYSEYFYVDNIMEKSINYDSNKNKIKEIFYVNGQQRTWIEYNKDGSVKNKGVY